MALFSAAELADAPPVTAEQQAVRWLLRLESEGLEGAAREEKIVKRPRHNKVIRYGWV